MDEGIVDEGIVDEGFVTVTHGSEGGQTLPVFGHLLY